MSGPGTMPPRVDPETRRGMFIAIFDVALAVQDEANGVELDTAGWIARGEQADRLAADAEQALQAVLRERAALAARVKLATTPPAGRA